MFLFQAGGSRPAQSRRQRGALALALLAVGLSAAASGQTFEVMHAFTVPPSEPSGGMIRGSDGAFYGTTQHAGGSSAGAVFRVDSSGNLTTLHTFSGEDGALPLSPVIQATDGSFYGTTFYGGAAGNGAVFKVDSAGNFTLLHSFSFSMSEGGNPVGGLVQATDGNFYGTAEMGGANTLGVVFKMTPAGTLTVIHDFGATAGDGVYPFASLIQGTDGNLYGTTRVGGTNNLGAVFKVTTSGTVTILHSFTESEGVNPSASVVQASDGKLYGTAQGGGANGHGSVFRVDISGSNFAVLHSFTGSDGSGPTASLIQASDGKLYGTTAAGGDANGDGTAFRIDTAGSNFSSLHLFAGADGSDPTSNVVQGTDGNFYGTTQLGGANDTGTFFRMSSAGAVTMLFGFGAASNGYEPSTAVLAAADGNIYGTTYRGGATNQGTVFKMDTSGNTTLLHSFAGMAGSDGANPFGELIQGTDGKFYGTTTEGGVNDYGSAFKMDSSGTVTLLHSFNATDGVSIDAGLVQGTDGKFYGTTYGGGPGDYGTTFRVDSSGTFASLHNFALSDGAEPRGTLIQATGGNFWGTTQSGGSNSMGTAFKMTAAGVVTTVHNFAGSEGAEPFGGLIQGTDGNFYGTSYRGGANQLGNIYKMTPAGVTTSLHDFTGADGAEPYGSLILASDGKFYGTTYSGGTTNHGTIFQIDSSGNFTSLHSFSLSDGKGPAAGLAQASDGRLYGTTNQGGSGAAGVVFRVAVCTSPPPSPTAGNNGPICAGQDLHLTASTVAGATYSWTGPNGFASTLQNPVIAGATTAATGTYSVRAIVAGCASSPANTTATVRPLPSAAITTAGAVCPSSGGHVASVPDAGLGATYSWSITNGTITGGAGTRSITFSVGTSGPVGLSVTVTDTNGCSANGSVSIPLSGCLSFYSLTPCRVIDTRGPAGPLGGPALTAGTIRTFAIGGHCGIPASAKAVSINVTMTQPSVAGDLRLFPGGAALPLVSTINYRSGQTRANNAVMALGATGLAVLCDQASGTVQVIVDVNGYFQ